jgi:hypothetical protein
MAAFAVEAGEAPALGAAWSDVLAGAAGLLELDAGVTGAAAGGAAWGGCELDVDGRFSGVAAATGCGRSAIADTQPPMPSMPAPLLHWSTTWCAVASQLAGLAEPLSAVPVAPTAKAATTSPVAALAARAAPAPDATRAERRPPRVASSYRARGTGAAVSP